MNAALESKKKAVRDIIRNGPSDLIGWSPLQIYRALNMLRAFEAVLRAYKGNTYISLKATQAYMKNSSKAAEVADSLGLDYHSYVVAQFRWFKQKFRKAPMLHQIGTENARYRAEQYMALRAAGKVRTLPVVPDLVMAGESDMIAAGNRTLDKLKAAWNIDEREVLRIFAARPDAGVFHSAWLNQNATYQQLKDAGEVQ